MLAATGGTQRRKGKRARRSDKQVGRRGGVGETRSKEEGTSGRNDTHNKERRAE